MLQNLFQSKWKVNTHNKNSYKHKREGRAFCVCVGVCVCLCVVVQCFLKLFSNGSGEYYEKGERKKVMG